MKKQITKKEAKFSYYRRILNNLDFISKTYLLNSHKITQFFAIFCTMGVITLAFMV